MLTLDAAASLLVLFLLGVFVYGPWQEICTDYARQVIFEKRDALFDLANSEEWSFESQEYRTIRAALEELIRFAHELTLPASIFFWFFVRPRRKNEKPHVLLAVERITDALLREKVLKVVDEAFKAAAIMAILKSPLAIILLTAMTAVFAPLALIGVGVSRCARAIFGKSTLAIQFEAERVGSIGQAAAA